MSAKLPQVPKQNGSQSEREVLKEWLDNFKPRTKLGQKLVALSKKGLTQGEPLLDADGILHQLGRRRYDE